MNKRYEWLNVKRKVNSVNSVICYASSIVLIKYKGIMQQYNSQLAANHELQCSNLSLKSQNFVNDLNSVLILQEFEKQYTDANVLLVTVTDEESRRIEQQPDSQTKAEIMEVVRSMFPDEDVPDATDILVPRWWSDRFFRGSFSNWPIGVSRYEYDQLRVRTTTPTKC